MNAATGVATIVGAPGVFTLNGTSFGFDFNPVPDRIRITSDADQNLRVNPNDGTLTATDGTLAYAAGDANAGQNPNIVGSAYTNSFATAQATFLYDIDSARDTLVFQDPPNSGTLNTVGNLGVDTIDNVGFDISGTTGVAYAALTVGGTTNLYTINLRSGAATATATANIIAPTALGTETIVDISAPVKAGSRLLNLSTRGNVGTGDNVLIAGFISREGVSSRVVIRGLGPSTGVAQALQDPVLFLFDKNGVQIATNDDFGSSPDQAAELTALGLPPKDPREPAIVTALAPDAYTAQIVGKNGATGVALVEVYQFQ